MGRLSEINGVDQEISRELKNLIRERITLSEENVLDLLESYNTVDNMAWDMLRRLQEEKEAGHGPTSNPVRELLMSLGGTLRVRNDLERMLQQILRRRDTDEREHKGDRRNSEDEGVVRLTSSQKRALLNPKNRQHRDRVSKRHEEVPSESPNHKS